MRYFNLLLTAVIGLNTASVLFGAELIVKPNGIMLHCITDWEQADSIDVFDRGGVTTIDPLSYSAQYTYEYDSFCINSGYRINYKGGFSGPYIDLSHLCFQKDEDIFRFAYISDSQEFPDEYEKTLNYIDKLRSDYQDLRMILHGGDYSHKGNESSWQLYREKTMKITSQKLPILPVLGNHEYWDDPDINFYRKVFADSAPEGAYFKMYDFNLFVLIVLDSNDDKRSPEQRQAQDTWFENTLSAMKNDHRRVIVAFHHPTFTSGIGVIFTPHDPEYVREHWIPLIEKYEVPLVLTAHEHVYERLVKNNVNYLVSGPAGGKRSPAGFKSKYSVKKISRTRTVTIISVHRDGMIELNIYSSDNDLEIDQLKINPSL